MDPLVQIARKGRPKPRIDDSWVDRLSSRYTVVVLLAFTLLVGVAFWVRNPMTCWLPKNYDIDERPFIKLYCWVENTYYLPYTQYIPKAHEHEKKGVIVYYQWIPFILLVQAFCFWFPSGVWHWLSAKARLDIKGILEQSLVLQNTAKLDTRKKRMEDLISYLDYFLTYGERTREKNISDDRKVKPRRGCCRGSFLVFSYMFVKLLYLLNLIFQMFALSGLLNTHYFTHGANHVNFHRDDNSTMDGETWNSPIFPRVAFCDYVIRELGNNRRHTTQCVMNYNIYLERLYLFLWFWMMIIMLITSADFFVWFLRNVIHSSRLSFVRNLLQCGDGFHRDDLAMSKSFIDHYLCHDGCFILRIIAQNVGAMTSADIIEQLWKVWGQRDFGNDNIHLATKTDSTEDDTLPLRQILSQKQHMQTP